MTNILFRTNQFVFIRLLLIFLVATLCGCSDSNNKDSDKEEPQTKLDVPNIDDIEIRADIDSNNFYLGQSNNARLSGDAFGFQKNENIKLQKSLAVTVESASGFSISRGNFTRDSTDSVLAYWFIPITNTSNEIRCNVHLNNIAFRDKQGKLLTDINESSSWVYGSIFSTATDTHDNCIKPGSTVYASSFVFSDRDGELFNAIYWLDVESIEYDQSLSSNDLVSPSGNLLPIRYRTNGDIFLEVTLQNTGKSAIKLNNYSPSIDIIAFDSSGLPLSYFLLRLDVNDADTIEPGETIITKPDTINYTGFISHIRVISDFDVVM